MKFSSYILMMAITIWGIILGGIVYSHLVYFPMFFADLPNSAIIVTGPYGLDESIFWMSIHPIMIIVLIITFIANRKFSERKKLILLSIILYIIVLIVSALYFVPELIKFADSAKLNLTTADWKQRTDRWYMLSLIRGIFMLSGIVPLLIALTKPQNTSDVIRSKT